MGAAFGSIGGLITGLSVSTFISNTLSLSYKDTLLVNGQTIILSMGMGGFIGYVIDKSFED